MSWETGWHVCSFGSHPQNSTQCLQVVVSIEIPIVCSWTNFSGNLEEVKHHKEEASYGAKLAVFHGHGSGRLYSIDWTIRYVFVNYLYLLFNSQYERSSPGPSLSDRFLTSTRSPGRRTEIEAFLS